MMQVDENSNNWCRKRKHYDVEDFCYVMYIIYRGNTNSNSRRRSQWRLTDFLPTQHNTTICEYE